MNDAQEIRLRGEMARVQEENARLREELDHARNNWVAAADANARLRERVEKAEAQLQRGDA